MSALEEQLGSMEEQLWAAQAEVRRLNQAIADQRAAELQARVDTMRAEVERNPDPHTLLDWIDVQLWAEDAEWIQGALAQLLNEYFVALHKRQAGAA